jgi:cysteine-rich secretory family protein
MKLTRLVGLAAALAAGCTATMPRDPEPGPLLVRAPNLDRPLMDVYPAPSLPEDPVKLAVFERINRDREDAGLPPVAWDEAASQVADRFCADQIEEGTRGHFLMDGMPPYARTAFAGIFAQQSENSVSWMSSGAQFSQTPEELALAGQESMLAEVPPSDGHRRTILEPDATHVGVGWAQEQGQFRMAQEFLIRRLAQLTLQRVAEDPNTVLFRGRARPPYRLDFVTFAHEPSPPPLTRAEASARERYGYPQAGLAFVPEGIKSMQVVGALTEDRLRLEPNGDFSFRFTPSMPGLWTVTLYASTGRERARPGGLAVLWIETAAVP